MYCLEVLKSASYQNPPKHAAPALTARDCSYCRSRSGLVLHSAIHRSTVFIYATDPRFPSILRKLKRRTRAGRNRLIESFF
jgi:hypothetical protein